MSTAFVSRRPRIVRVVAYGLELPFAQGPYAMSGLVESAMQSTVVALHTEDGTVGWGETAPLGTVYAPAFAGGARAALSELAPVVLGLDAGSPGLVTAALDEALRGHPYAKSAIDMAAWDLAARLVGRPLCDLLGGRFGETVPAYRVLPFAEPAETAELARRYVEAGYRRLQVKIGRDPDLDLASVAAVQEAVGTEFTLYADANGGYAPLEARAFLRGLEDRRLVIEQPCATIEECAALRSACSWPIVLDESIDSLQALLRARELRVADGITIKLARLGGISPSRLVRDVAVALRIPVTVEDTGGSDIDTAAIAHLALSTPERLRMHAYPFHAVVTVSNAEGMPPVTGGKLVLPIGPGLGVSVRKHALGPPVLDVGL